MAALIRSGTIGRLGLALAAAACATEPPPPVPERLVPATATTLTGTVGAELEVAPEVRATDAEGRGVAGVIVAFRAGEGHGTVARAEAETDADGRASVGGWTLGPGVGAQTLTASVEGLAEVVFTATATAGPVAVVAVVGGNDQLASAGESVAAELRVRVADAFGNPVAGAPVAFAVITGGGSIGGAATVSDVAGQAASGPWTLGPAAGEQRVRAASGGGEATFSAFAIAATGAHGGRLAFVAEADGNHDIYAVNADGSDLRRLTTHPGRDLQPAWAPGGARIAFVAVRDQQSRIYTMGADGGDLTPSIDQTLSEDPAWSPDGRLLTYTSLRDGSAQVVTLDTRDATVSVLAADNGYDAQASWSPDGRQLAFVSDRVAYDFVFDIFTMNADGSEEVQRTHGFDLGLRGIRYYLHPAWSPDGSLIALISGEFIGSGGMRFRVAVMAPDGTSLRELAWAGDIPELEALDPGSLTWAPDGRGIAYTFVDCDLVGGLGCSGRRRVNYVPLEGGTPVTLIPIGHSPSWH